MIHYNYEHYDDGQIQWASMIPWPTWALNNTHATVCLNDHPFIQKTGLMFFGHHNYNTGNSWELQLVIMITVIITNLETGNYKNWEFLGIPCPIQLDLNDKSVVEQSIVRVVGMGQTSTAIWLRLVSHILAI